MEEMNFSRKVDDTGRIVIPSELRDKLGIQKQDQLEIYLDDAKIVISKSLEMCTFCYAVEHLTKIETKYICDNCKEKMK